jgi:hypothetical protein
MAIYVVSGCPLALIYVGAFNWSALIVRIFGGGVRSTNGVIKDEDPCCLCPIFIEQTFF